MGCDGDRGIRGPQDIRQKLVELEQHKRRVYPVRDLVTLEWTLGQVLEKVIRS